MIYDPETNQHGACAESCPECSHRCTKGYDGQALGSVHKCINGHWWPAKPTTQGDSMRNVVVGMILALVALAATQLIDKL